ncbi:MAG: xanthine dehydrogenase family protein molybdopterin-binding subunit [Acidimicrobiia bacterium]
MTIGGGASRSGVVGARIPGVDSYDKVTGRAGFAGDVRLPGMLLAAIVKSPVPKGRILAVDARAAMEIPGVKLVVTADDLRSAPIGCSDIRYGVVVRDRPILAEGRVSFQGEPVAAVVAVDRETARAAATQVVVDVEEEPAATDLDSALEPGAPLVHVAPFEIEDAVYKSPLPLEFGDSNVTLTYVTEDGDVEAALTASAKRYEASYRFPAIYQYAMEPFCSVAQVDRVGITVWSSAQHPSQVTRDLARIFDVPLANVRVVVPYVGGGFGSKSFTHIEPLTVALAKAVGGPVRLELDIAESMTISRRHNALARVRSGVDEHGQIVAFDIDLAYDGGAYTLLGPYVVAKGAFRGLGGYEFPNYRATSKLVFTNTSPAGSMRSVGGPQAAFALESHLDEIARDLGVDPYDFRRRHVAARGSEFRRGRTPMDADLHDDLKMLEAIPWESGSSDAGDSLLRGTGVAMGIADPGASPVSSAVVRLNADGSLTVSVGSTEIGQGVRTVVSQIAAETLGVPFEHVAVTYTDTGYGPYDASTGASRSTTMSGLAVHRATTSIRERVVRMAAETWGCEEGVIEIIDGVVQGPDSSEPLGYFVGEYFGQRGGNFFGVGEVTAHEFPTTPPFWEVAAAVADVVVDPDTGEIRVEAYRSMADVGKAVNPLLMEGQEEGAVVQGIGHTLFESMEWEDGMLMNDSILEYRVPRIGDIPTYMRGELAEGGDGPGPFGLKGAGEGGVIPVGGAVANAVFDATGARIRELPLTPERVWRAIRETRAGQGEEGR